MLIAQWEGAGAGTGITSQVRLLGLPRSSQSSPTHCGWVRSISSYDHGSSTGSCPVGEAASLKPNDAQRSPRLELVPSSLLLKPHHYHHSRTHPTLSHTGPFLPNDANPLPALLLISRVFATPYLSTTYHTRHCISVSLTFRSPHQALLVSLPRNQTRGDLLCLLHSLNLFDAIQQKKNRPFLGHFASLPSFCFLTPRITSISTLEIPQPFALCHKDSIRITQTKCHID